MERIKRVGHWLAGHKRWCVAVAALCVVGIGLGIYRALGRRGMTRIPTDLLDNQYVRTTRLEKTSLSDSITASGTVQSSQVSTVTTDQKYAVKEILVQVGDTVAEGDVICTLDTSELEESLEKARQTLEESQEKAAQQLEKAQQELTEATDTALGYESTVAQALQTLTGLQSRWQTAQDSVSASQTAYDNAQLASQQAGAQLNQLTADGADQAQLDAARQTMEAAQAALEQARQQLETAKQNCDYDNLQQQYTAAQTSYDQARRTLDEYEKSVVSCQEAVETAQEQLEQAGSSDEVEQLEQQLEKCTLRAGSAGKVTAVDAVVGSALSGSAATIQNTDALIVSITIQEYDIGSVTTGLRAVITSDVTEGEIEGELTQISPVASSGMDSSGGFSAEVTVKQADSGLLIGTNANVEIILSTTEDVFVVPLDAVEEQEDGSTVVYVKNDQGEFEPVQVTCGQENDYYVEISGDGLQEGMEVRSSAAEEVVSQEEQSDEIAMGGIAIPSVGGEMPGGEMTGGQGGQRPSMGGGMGGGSR